MNLAQVQDELRKQDIDGWLFFDHHNRDPLAYRILGLEVPAHVSRRWYYLVPAHGQPRALVHRIESHILDSLPSEKHLYASWQEHHSGIAYLLSGITRVAMQYSPLCQIPYVAMVDAGTIELIRQTGSDVVTSAELVQYFEASLSRHALDTHLESGRRVDAVRADTFHLIAERLRAQSAINEFEVADFVRDQFVRRRLSALNGPIVAVNANAADPHYDPPPQGSAQIRPGDFVLLDLWARLDSPGSIYYDITWNGYCGEIIPDRIAHVFSIVRDARDAAITRVRDGFHAHEDLRGCQVDDAARNYIRENGFADYFIHRTGHSIGQNVHGNSANMDNFEIQDQRKLIPWTCFSIEPGIYLDTFGIRSEINMFLTDSEALVTGEVQTEIVPIV